MDTLLPHSKVEFERVKDMKQRCLLGGSTTRDGNGTKLMPWDFIYYGAMLNKEVQVDHAAIAEYFPLRHTVSAMFDIFADCLQLRFEPIPKEELRKSIWYDDVEAWVVSDERLETKGDFIGFLFADLLGRPNKYKGNQSVNLQPVRFPLLSCAGISIDCSLDDKGYLKPDSTRVYPANILMCNFNSSTPTTGCLLNHNSVKTLFHGKIVDSELLHDSF
jgi:metallopeptidase MepB